MFGFHNKLIVPINRVLLKILRVWISVQQQSANRFTDSPVQADALSLPSGDSLRSAIPPSTYPQVRCACGIWVAGIPPGGGRGGGGAGGVCEHSREEGWVGERERGGGGVI